MVCPVFGWFVGAMARFWMVCGWYGWFVADLSMVWLVCGWFVDSLVGL